MNEALQRWREEFASEPDTAFDRLVRGVVPLGGASQLSFGEILDALFDPGDAALDAAAAGWLRKHILGSVPDNISLHRWVSVLEEYFRGIAAMELSHTGEILRRQHNRIRLWLHGFYEGPDRDPEGAYLIALARAQDDQRFSPLWRRLILGEELVGRPYIGIGILGFRKKPGLNSPESSGVPEGLLQAVVELADKPGIGHARWKQIVRGLFATYRRSPGYWVEHLAPLLPYYELRSNAREWLSSILPGIVSWRPPVSENNVPLGAISKVPRHVVQHWIQHIREDASLCDRADFLTFLDQLRAYAKATGNPEYINKTLNNISTSLVDVDRGRAELAVSFMEEALWWAPWDPYNWTTYAIALGASERPNQAVDVLWRARQRFAWNKVIHAELGRVLREMGDLETAVGVLSEAITLFPNDLICRHSLVKTLVLADRLPEALSVVIQTITDFPDESGALYILSDTLVDLNRLNEALEIYELASSRFPQDSAFKIGQAKTLRALRRTKEARVAYEQAVNDFPDDIAPKTALADFLIDLDEIEAAEAIFQQVLQTEKHNSYARGGLSRAWSIRSARTRDIELRDKAKRILLGLANEGSGDAITRFRVFDGQWEQATTDPSNVFRREGEDRPTQTFRTMPIRATAAMSTAERLGRAMITLWQAERAEDPARRSSLCADANSLLEVPEDQIDADLFAAFVETRGLILLASGDAPRALAYFEEQICHYGRGGWIGIQLGDQRARIALGMPPGGDDTAEAPSSQSARFALYVARVIQTLSASPQESEVRDLLKAFYPRAADLAARARSDAEGRLSIESGAEMLGAFLQARWFRPAGIQSAEDLDRPDALHSVIDCINNTRTDTFDVISNSTLAIAA